MPFNESSTHKNIFLFIEKCSFYLKTHVGILILSRNICVNSVNTSKQGANSNVYQVWYPYPKLLIHHEQEVHCYNLCINILTKD